MTKYKTVKRAAKVGERILITDATCNGSAYVDGDILTVCRSIDSGDVDVEEHDVAIWYGEYEVIDEEIAAPDPFHCVVENYSTQFPENISTVTVDVDATGLGKLFALESQSRKSSKLPALRAKLIEVQREIDAIEEALQ